MALAFFLRRDIMICPKCNIEYSDKVYRLHVKDCNVKKVVNKKEIKEEDDVRQLAKAKGIKSWHVKTIDKLKAEISEAK